MKENIIVAARVILLPLLIMCSVIHLGYNYRYHKLHHHRHVHVKTDTDVNQQAAQQQIIEQIEKENKYTEELKRNAVTIIKDQSNSIEQQARKAREAVNRRALIE